MPAYKYRAVHASGRVSQGSVAAANEGELMQHLTLAGLELIEARVQKNLPRLRMPQRTSPRRLAVFTSQIYDLLKAGVSFIDALRECTQTMEPGALRDALTDIHRNINHGTRIAVAFGAYPRLFPSVFTSILAAGESSGNLIETFAQLARYAESRAKTSEQLHRALRYPLFLLIVAFSVIGFMMTLVVPKVVSFLNTIDGDLPPSTRILMAVSSVVADGWWWMLIGAAFCIAFIGWLHRSSEHAAMTIDTLLLRIPLFGEVLKKLALARFAHSFAALFQSGVGILSALRSAKGTLGNKALEAAIEDVALQVQAGRALSGAMSGILPSFALRMIRTGEHSGQLSKSLGDIAIAYDREVTDVTERMIGMMEPALTVLIGMLLAWVVLAVLSPIYGSIAKLNTMGY
ncbi:MAG TPA: type II secretion system F family protein [Alphaproteobacteria bacterium]|nr:type II secretion system F family protein [Alphaproteobacteria bacterium]